MVIVHPVTARSIAVCNDPLRVRFRPGLVGMSNAGRIEGEWGWGWGGAFREVNHGNLHMEMSFKHTIYGAFHAINSLIEFTWRMTFQLYIGL